MTEEEKAYVREEYLKNEKTISQIAVDVNQSFNTVNTYIRRAKDRGLIPRTEKRRYTKNRKVHHFDIKPKKVKEATTLKPGESVNCTLKVARSCIYGLANDHCGLCDYQAKAGTSRILVSPDPTHCTVYVKK